MSLIWDRPWDGSRRECVLGKFTMMLLESLSHKVIKALTRLVVMLKRLVRDMAGISKAQCIKSCRYKE